MGVFAEPYYSVRCDEKGCDIVAEFGDYSAWKDREIAEEQAQEDGWVETIDPTTGPHWRCPNHPEVSDD